MGKKGEEAPTLEGSSATKMEMLRNKFTLMEEAMQR
jgi:hypothetical protein